MGFNGIEAKSFYKTISWPTSITQHLGHINMLNSILSSYSFSGSSSGYCHFTSYTMVNDYNNQNTAFTFGIMHNNATTTTTVNFAFAILFIAQINKY